MTLNPDSRSWWNRPWNAPWITNLLKVIGGGSATYHGCRELEKSSSEAKTRNYRRKTALTKNEYTPEQFTQDAATDGKSIGEIQEDLMAWGQVNERYQFQRSRTIFSHGEMGQIHERSSY